MRTIAVAATIAALVWCPAAVAHGGGVPGFTSTVQAITPPVAGVEVTVLDGDDRLRLRNASGEEVVVLGYDEEPYLRFSGDGVYENVRSEATYVNDDRYGQVSVPETADPDADPEWRRVSDGTTYEWHDHRIHWMSPENPPQVRAAPDRPHHVFDWEIPVTAGGERVVVAGSLDYRPPDKGGAMLAYIAAPVGALLLAGGVLAWRRTRRTGA